jgi:hypothetical protein
MVISSGLTQSCKLFTAELKRDKMLPDLDDSLLMRDKPHIYSVFYDYVLPCIVGNVYWKEQHLANW